MQNGFTKDCVVSAWDVKNAISKLKAHKSDGNFVLNTDYFLNAGNDLHIHVALLFQLFSCTVFLMKSFLLAL